MKKRFDAKHLTTAALLLAAAFILSWIEFALSIPMVIPGMKIGLANLAIVFTMYYCGNKDALLVLGGRLILNAVLFGNAASLIYSAAGGVLSFVIMCICKKLLSKNSDKNIITVSAAGGIFHNVGQLIAAFAVVNSFAPLVYLPYLIIGGLAAGILNGFISKRILSCSYFKNNRTAAETK